MKQNELNDGHWRTFLSIPADQERMVKDRPHLLIHELDIESGPPSRPWKIIPVAF